MPDLVMIEIFFHMNPESIVVMSRVNKQFYDLANENSLWRRKTKKHFPHRLPNGAEKFKSTYNDEYEKIPKEKRILFSLVKEGDIKRLKEILTLCDLKLNDKRGQSLLDWAIFYKHQIILDFIYEIVKQASNDGKGILHPANTHGFYEEVTLLHWAVLCNQPSDIIKKLLVDGCDINQDIIWYGRPIEIASELNYTKLIKTLLKNKAECVYYKYGSMHTALYTAAGYGNIEVVKILYEQLITNKPDVLNKKYLNENLYIASQNGHAEIANFFLKHGAEVNSKRSFDMTSLFIASCRGNFETVAVLIKNGADVNAHNNDGTTALYVAVQINDVKLVHFLLRHGADVHQCRYPSGVRFTPIAMAASNGSTEIIKALIDKGANINYICGMGMTSLHHAVKHGKVNAARLLLEKGADINAKCKNKTPLDFAKESKNQEMIELLLPYHRCSNFSEKNKKSNHVNLSLLNNKKIHTTNASSSQNSKLNLG